MRDTETYLAIAGHLADAAREAILPYFRAEHGCVDKGQGGFDPVTEADKAAERAMRAIIERELPDHGILGEEYGEREGGSGYQWIIDPIDGTRAFIAGLPTWGVLIGLAYEGKPIIGIMDQPYLDERYRGWNDAADCVIRGEQRAVRTRACATLGNAILSTTTPDLFHGEEAEAFGRVREKAKLTRYGYDCYAYAMVASGHMDFVVESGLKPFDIAALIPILRGAGGGVCSWDGGEASQGGRVLAYGDASVRDHAMELLR